MKLGKCASGRERSKYTSSTVGKLWVNILESDKRPDGSEMLKKDRGLENGGRGVEVRDHAGSCLQCGVVWILF